MEQDAPGSDASFSELERTLRLILPETYQDRYEDVQPVSMGSAGLKYGSDGLVAWSEIWGSFCDLAMAGGPPHRGTLLEPAYREDIEAHSSSYQQVVGELCRGLAMVSGLPAEESHLPGWIHVYCRTGGMASWLARAIVMENVTARFDGRVLCLPAGPAYRVEKEIKNVITAFAKSCHYWLHHTSGSQRQSIANLFLRMERKSPTIQPPPSHPDAYDLQALSARIAASAVQRLGVAATAERYPGWVALDYVEVRAAIAMMRLLAAGNVLARREQTLVFVPVDPAVDPDGEFLLGAIEEAHHLATAKKMLAGNS